MALACLGPACVWPSPERQLLIDFFQACRVYDTAVLARLSTVDCDPAADGIVEEFQMVTIARAAEARRVTIRARVRPFEGEASERTLTVSLARQEGRWRVTGLTPSRASRTSPAASSAPPK